MQEIKEKNAVITGASLSTADHGVLSGFVYLDYGGTGQGFGGYQLYNPNFPHSKSFAGKYIYKIMEVVGVTEWSKLEGMTVRVRASHNKVHAIGHIVKDRWFDIEREALELDSSDED